MKADESILICTIIILGVQNSHHFTKGVALLYRTPVILPLKPWRVVVNVRHRDGHYCGGGERQHLTQVRGHDFKAVAGTGLMVHLAHCRDPACFAVDGKDRTSSDWAAGGGGAFQLHVLAEQRSKAVGYLQFDEYSSR